VYDIIIVVAAIKYVASCRPGRAAFKPEPGRGMIYGRRTDTNGSFRPADQALRPNLDPQIYGELCTRALTQTDYCVCVCVRVYVCACVCLSGCGNRRCVTRSSCCRYYDDNNNYIHNCTADDAMRSTDNIGRCYYYHNIVIQPHTHTHMSAAYIVLALIVSGREFSQVWITSARFLVFVASRRLL